MAKGWSDRFVVKPGSRLRLSRRDPGDAGEWAGRKDEARKAFAESSANIVELQRKLFAQGKHALLCVFQALDAGGKDGTIRNVLGPINPQGCHVTNFRAPTEEELAHDFLWRAHRAVPAKGMIGVFNRSHYEDVLVVRVHDIVPRAIWSKRYERINDFEALLADNGVVIRKFFLHISKEEQAERFQDRLDDPRKHWKVNPRDFEERRFWDDYQKAFEDALSRCSTAHAPWYVVPANRKWYRNLVVARILEETLDSLDLRYPEADFDPATLKIV